MNSPKINLAHEIAELVCRRRFKTKGFETLPIKFWNDIRFARDYKVEMIKTRALMKIYSGEAILAALKSGQGKTIYSITAPWLDALVAVEQEKIRVLAKRLEDKLAKLKVDETIVVPDGERPTYKPDPSILDKLD